MAHVALLHTEMKLGLRLRPSTDMKSPVEKPAASYMAPQIQHSRLAYTRLDVLEACLCEVPQESEGALAHLRHGVLHALEEEAEDVGLRHQLLDVALQPFRQPRQQVQGHDHELLVRGHELLGVGQSDLEGGGGGGRGSHRLELRGEGPGAGHLSLVQGLSHQGHTALEHRLTVRQEPRLQSSGH